MALPTERSYAEALDARDPLAIDQAIGLEQGRVLEQGQGGSLHVHGESPVFGARQGGGAARKHSPLTLGVQYRWRP